MKKNFFYFIIFLLLISCSFIPKPTLLNDHEFSRSVYDSNGTLLYLHLTHDQKYRIFTPLDKISPTLINMTLLQEDQYFYNHFGINPAAFLKALFKTYIQHERRFGGSTITMQTARLQFNIHSHTALGKLWQIIKALQLELHYSKKEILTAYFNLVPYSNNIEGIGAASLIYFHKSPQNINNVEAATLAVMPQNPKKRSPAQRKTALYHARNHLLKRYHQQHPAEKIISEHLPVQIETREHLPFLAPQLTQLVLQRYPDSKLITSIDYFLQHQLEKITQQYISQNKINGLENAAILLVDTRNMQVKTSIGSANFFDKKIHGQVNGTIAKRSPGSTLKPFIYALALDQSLIHPYSILKDAPMHFGKYAPENFDDRFLGPIRALDALILSRNIPAILLASQLKSPSFYEFLQNNHIRDLKSEKFYGLSLVLGGAEITMEELVSLYAMLNNEGKYRSLCYLKHEKFEPGEHQLSPEAAYLTLWMLQQNPRPEGSFNGEEHHALPIAWKTGTSSAFRDAWAIGMMGPYVMAVWVGDFAGSSNPHFIGQTAAAPLLFQLLDSVYQTQKPFPFFSPESKNLAIKKVAVCAASGMLPTPYCPHTEETWFIPGKSPIQKDTVFREVMIDRVTKKRSCSFDPNHIFRIYEFWPSDLFILLQMAHRNIRVPPPFSENCRFDQKNLTGSAPEIISPTMHGVYKSQLANGKLNTILLSAICDGDVHNIHWFINEKYLGKSDPKTPLIWSAKPGKYNIRVVDEMGRVDKVEIVIES